MNGELRVLFPQIKSENTFVFETRLFTPQDKLYMAPMQFLTDYRFRNAYDKIFPNAIDKAITPFISLTHGSLKFGKRKYKEVLKENNISEMDIIPQVLGNDINGLIEVADALFSLGYKEMNWNLGCPYRRSLNKDRGAGLLKDTQRIEKIIDAIVNKIPINLSLKLRLGVESIDDIYRLIPIINAYPLSRVVIHPRLAKDKYSSEVDLNCFEDILSKLNKRVVYNGDIFSKQDFNRLKMRFPSVCDWMIGRGLLFNPCLPYEIKLMEYPIKKERIIALHNELLKNFSSVNKLKEYWTFFAKGLFLNESDINLIYETKTTDELDIVVKRILKLLNP